MLTSFFTHFHLDHQVRDNWGLNLKNSDALKVISNDFLLSFGHKVKICTDYAHLLVFFVQKLIGFCWIFKDTLYMIVEEQYFASWNGGRFVYNHFLGFKMKFNEKFLY